MRLSRRSFTTCILGGCRPLTVKKENAAARRANYQTIVCIRAESRNLAQLIVGSRLRPNQRALRPLQFFYAITISRDVGGAVGVGDRAHVVALRQFFAWRRNA